MLLLKQIEAEHIKATGRTGEKSGAQARMMRLTGLKDGHISMLLSGERNAGQHTVNSVQAKMKLRVAFFTDPTLVNPHYRQFLEKDSPALDPEPEMHGGARSESGEYYVDFAAAAAAFTRQGANPREIRALAGLGNLLRSERDVKVALETMRLQKKAGATDAVAVDAAAEVVENLGAAERAAAAQEEARQPSSTPPAPDAPKGSTPDRRRSGS